jgi:hypothetical protein
MVASGKSNERSMPVSRAMISRVSPDLESDELSVLGESTLCAVIQLVL